MIAVNKMGDLALKAAAILELRRRERERKGVDFSIWDAYQALRPNQKPPEDFVSYWLLLAGRGFGKTHTLATWANWKALTMPQSRGVIAAPTAADVRDTMIEGASGVLAKAHPDYRPRYEPSKRRLSWSNGSVATLLGADEPERFRGGNYHWAVCDELRAWRRPESFDLLQFAVRLPYNEIPPQVTIATTPIGSPLLKRLLSDKGVVITRGSTYDNRGNLAQGFFEQIIKRYEGTRLGKQELDGVLLGDIQGALWTWEMLEKAREGQGWTGEGRIVVAVDPAISSGSDSDETGIIVVGKGRSDRRYYVLEDASLKASPDNWARAAINAYNRWRADRIVYEENQGGEMVASVLRTVRPDIPLKAVRATRAKRVRAEPIAALYEQNQVHHEKFFPELDEQLTGWVATSAKSPDRLDALVWAITELMGGGVWYT
jgi:predicted phage terminase large subunit-like protein